MTYGNAGSRRKGFAWTQTNPLALSPDASLLALTRIPFSDSDVALFDVRSDSKILEDPTPADGSLVTSARFSPDRSMVFFPHYPAQSGQAGGVTAFDTSDRS